MQCTRVAGPRSVVGAGSGRNGPRCALARGPTKGPAVPQGLRGASLWRRFPVVRAEDDDASKASVSTSDEDEEEVAALEAALEEDEEAAEVETGTQVIKAGVPGTGTQVLKAPATGTQVVRVVTSADEDTPEEAKARSAVLGTGVFDKDKIYKEMEKEVVVEPIYSSIRARAAVLGSGIFTEANEEEAEGAVAVEDEQEDPEEARAVNAVLNQEIFKLSSQDNRTRSAVLGQRVFSSSSRSEDGELAPPMGETYFGGDDPDSRARYAVLGGETFNSLARAQQGTVPPAASSEGGEPGEDIFEADRARVAVLGLGVFKGDGAGARTAVRPDATVAVPAPVEEIDDTDENGFSLRRAKTTALGMGIFKNVAPVEEEEPVVAGRGGIDLSHDGCCHGATWENSPSNGLQGALSKFLDVTGLKKIASALQSSKYTLPAACAALALSVIVPALASGAIPVPEAIASRWAPIQIAIAYKFTCLKIAVTYNLTSAGIAIGNAVPAMPECIPATLSSWGAAISGMSFPQCLVAAAFALAGIPTIVGALWNLTEGTIDTTVLTAAGACGAVYLGHAFEGAALAVIFAAAKRFFINSRLTLSPSA